MIEVIKEGEYAPIGEKRKRHKCYRCGTLYEYTPHIDASNDYVDQEDFTHYDCPICGLMYYPFYRFFGWLWYKVFKFK